MNNIEQFKTKGYCIVPSAISSELRDFITQYALFDEMQDFKPDLTQVKGAHSKYADPAMESLLLLLHKIMEQNTGLTLSPTYSYYRVYRAGDILDPHVDRPSCEVSATLCFNYSYSKDEYTWPIIMDSTIVDLLPGDMVIYRGCELTHSRDMFNYTNDSWHVQGFFHYVDANGPYADYKYDKRALIGELPVPTNTQKTYIRYTQ